MVILAIIPWLSLLFFFFFFYHYGGVLFFFIMCFLMLKVLMCNSGARSFV